MPDLDPNPRASRWREHLIVAHLCLLGAARVLLFAAAFPYFHNVDEPFHLDMIVRYSHHDVPDKLVPLSDETAGLVAANESPEFLAGAADFPGGQLPSPLWLRERDSRMRVWQRNLELWHSQTQLDALDPPLYYALAGAWYNIGKHLGLSGGRILYWTRFLNAPIYFALVWITYALARQLFPESRLVYLGVPLLAAVFPQDAFYGLSDDVLSAPLAALSLLLLLKLDSRRGEGIGLAIGAGLCAAAACMTKLANAPVAVVVAGMGIFMLWRAIRAKQPRAAAVVLLLAMSLPIGFWLTRNYFHFGDPTAEVAKSRHLTWTLKPLAEYLSHPIFSPDGFVRFWSELFRTFWRGEFEWHGPTLAWPPADAMYLATSTIFLLCAIAGSVRDRRTGIIACMALIVLSIAMLVFLSIRFDFGTCPYPSQQWPYFTSGRLILCALAPFLILYVRGIDLLTRWLCAPWLAWPLLGLITAVALVSEIAISTNVFASPYNWFHLP